MSGTNNNYSQASASDAYLYGGSIYNTGNMNIDNSLINSNHVDGENSFAAAAGAIYNNSNLTITNSIIKDNYATSNNAATGGAIFNDTNGTLTIENSTLENNYLQSPDARGGAIGNRGTLIILSSTFKNNRENENTNDIYNENGTIRFQGEGTTEILGGIKGNGEIYKEDSGVLNLGGKAKINGKIYDVVSRNSYIEDGAHIKVVEIKDNTIIVRKWFE